MKLSPSLTSNKNVDLNFCMALTFYNTYVKTWLGSHQMMLSLVRQAHCKLMMLYHGEHVLLHGPFIFSTQNTIWSYKLLQFSTSILIYFIFLSKICYHLCRSVYVGHATLPIEHMLVALRFRHSISIVIDFSRNGVWKHVRGIQWC